MSDDVRSTLERVRVSLSESAPGDGFDLLSRYHRRRERRQRIAALAVGVLVAVAGTTIAVAAFRDAPAPPAGGVDPSVGNPDSGGLSLVREPNTLVVNVLPSESDVEHPLRVIATYGSATLEACSIRSLAAWNQPWTQQGGEPPQDEIACQRVAAGQDFLVPKWTHVRYEGEFQALDAWFSPLRGGNVHGPSLVPDGGGFHPLWIEVAGADGTSAFRLDVESGPGGPVSDHLTDVLQVRCDGSDAHVSSTIVVPTADGVSVEVLGEDGYVVEIRPWIGPFERWTVPAGAGVVTRPIWGADELVVRCSSSAEGDPVTAGLRAGEELVRTADANAVFEEYFLWCASLDWVAIGPSDDAAPVADNEDVVRSALEGIRSDDLIERAGYRGAEATDPVWTIRRDAIGVAAYVHATTLQGYACAGSGIGGA